MAAGRKKGRGARDAPKGAPGRAGSLSAQQAEQRAVKAVRLVRQGKSLTAAAKAAHSDPRTVKKYARAALRRRKGTYTTVPVDAIAPTHADTNS